MTDVFEQRIAELEVRVAFQDDTIDALNAALASQQQQLSQLQQAVSLLAQRQKELASQVPAEGGDEPPPPHY